MGRGFSQDPATFPQASYWPDIAAEIDGDDQAGRRQQLRATPLSSAWALVAEHPRIELAFWALAVAAKLDMVMGQSCGALARKCGVTEADFSKTVNYYCDLLRLPRPPALKSQRARAAYALAQRLNHWRDRNGKDFVRRKLGRGSAHVGTSFSQS